MKLLPIKEHLDENKEFAANPDCQDSLYTCIEFYKRAGFTPPWICYYVQLGGALVAAAAFKGKPLNNQVEIAYGTFPQYQKQGIGSRLVDILVQLSLKTDPAIRVTARTLLKENFSVRILRKNNFKLLGAILDDQDGQVWEWEYYSG